MSAHPGPDADELRNATALPSVVLTQYLASTGWIEAQHLERATLWIRHEQDGDFQVLVPADPSLRDYASRISDFLATVSAVEERPIRHVVDDLRVSEADTLAFRLRPSGPSGTIPLFNAVEALMGVKELVVASTFASLHPGPVLVQGRRPDSVLDFARSFRLGTPQPGSWAIAAQLAIPTDSDDGQPLARRVTLQMHRTVSACFTAAAEALRKFDLDVFLRRLGDGVSANACDALARVGRDGIPYDVRFGWARQLPANVHTGSFRFSTRHVDILRRAADQLRDVLPDGDITVEGEVNGLRREHGDGGQATVRGSITTGRGREDRAVRISLPEYLYEQVVDAHRSRRRVRVTGIVFRGRFEQVTRLDLLDAVD